MSTRTSDSNKTWSFVRLLSNYHYWIGLGGRDQLVTLPSLTQSCLALPTAEIPGGGKGGVEAGGGGGEGRWGGGGDI